MELLSDKFLIVSLLTTKLLGLLVIIVTEVFFELNIVAQEQRAKTKFSKIIYFMCLVITTSNTSIIDFEKI